MTLPLPPGKNGLPLLGEMLDFAKGQTEFIRSRVKQHGPVFRSSLFGAPVAFISGAENFGVFLDPAKFTRAGASPPPLLALLGADAVPFLDGPAHLVRKRILMKAVGRDVVGKLMPTMEAAVAAFLPRWATGAEISLVNEIPNLAFAAMDAIFTGAAPDSVDAPAKAAFDAFLGGLAALPINLPGTRWSKALAARKTLLAYFGKALERHRKSPPERFDVMTGLMNAEEQGTRLTDAQIVTEILHFFFAAYAGIYAWLIDLVHALSVHSEAREQLRFEVSVVAPAGALTVERLGRLEFLDRVAREVKRSYPVIPFTFFARALADVEVGGVRVPKGWRAMGCTVETMNDPAIWAAPGQFDPERFAAPRSEQDKHPHAMVVQGGGPIDGHRCAGEALSDALMKVFAVHLLRAYQWEVPEQDLAMNLASVPPVPRGGMRVKVRPA